MQKKQICPQLLPFALFLTAGGLISAALKFELTYDLLRRDILQSAAGRGFVSVKRFLQKRYDALLFYCRAAVRLSDVYLV